MRGNPKEKMPWNSYAKPVVRVEKTKCSTTFRKQQEVLILEIGGCISVHSNEKPYGTVHKNRRKKLNNMNS